MYGASPYIEDDDDDVPPGFESRRGKLGTAKQGLPYPPPDSSSYRADDYSAQRTPAIAAHQQHSYQQYQPPPGLNGQASYGYAPPALGRVNSGDVAAGGARQFQRALSGSMGGQQQQQQPTPRSPRGRQSSTRAQPGSAPNAPDYGGFNDSDEEYGAPSSSSRRRSAGSKLNPASRGGSSSDFSSSRGPTPAGSSPAYQQQQQRGGSSSPGASQHNSASPPNRTGSYGSLHSSKTFSASGASPARAARPGGQLPPLAAQAAPPGLTGPAGLNTSSHRSQHPLAAAAAAMAGTSGADVGSAARARGAPSPEPDYGEYGDGDDYGQESKGSRRRSTRQGSSSRQRSGSRGSRPPPAAVPLSPEMAVAAATQALAGINPPPQAKAEKGPRRPRNTARRGSPTPMSAERTAQLEAELEALRGRLLEAEAREVEAHMAVISLHSDNTSLQAQLSGMRQQKQQLEQMLLFGSDQQDSEDGDQYTSSYSGQSEGVLEADNSGPLAADETPQQQQQQDDVDAPKEQGTELDLLDLGFLENGAGSSSGAAGEAAAAAAGPAGAAGGLSSEIAEALAAAEAAATAAAAGEPVGGVPSGMSRSVSQEIAEALAAAEAAADAAVAAGSTPPPAAAAEGP